MNQEGPIVESAQVQDEDTPRPVLSYGMGRIWQPGERNGRAALVCAVVAWVLAGMGMAVAFEVVPVIANKGNLEPLLAMLGFGGGILTAVLGSLLGYFGQPVRGPAHYLTNIGFWMNALLLIALVVLGAAPAWIGN